ncbi:amidohydrolase family protein [Pelagibacterium xiamenense]|uniref:amidohydrolase family protein n=1 Tax=Pelagibacterium xiamenense TaxID=2901140 RepID=UPI001E325029|nr:amidohydrolase family protein [Pelagibacterium xiamenense]MCD7058619.1 amidohydrolase [Pelagibacterium xiamenense]
MTVVDIHPHIVSRDTARYPMSPIGGKRSDWSHQRSIELDTLIESMDAAGVDKAAVVHSSTTYGFNCDYVADAIAQHPDRLTGVFSVNVLEPEAPEAMRHWYERGLTGMRIFARGSTLKQAWLSIDDPRVFPCYELAGELGIPVATNATVKMLEQIETVVSAFPKVSFVIDHLGRSDFSDGPPYDNAAPILSLARFPNVYLKVTTNNLRESRDGKSDPMTLFPKLVSVFGADRMAWGSNYPASQGTLEQMVDLARDCLAGVSQADRDLIMGGTALNLYPALAEKTASA